MIRQATDDDAGVIADLWNWMIRDTLWTFTTEEKSVNVIKDLISTRGYAFQVYCIDETPVGFITFGSFRSGPGYMGTVELSIVVAPGMQGRGIGRNLMDTAQSAASKAGHHVMVAAISSANEGAVAFHEKSGFLETGRMPEVGRKGGQWLDLILMQKFLT